MGNKNKSANGEQIADAKIVASRAESCVHVLRGLTSYHERMTMGEAPERDFYLDALRFALACVEEKAG